MPRAEAVAAPSTPPPMWPSPAPPPTTTDGTALRAHLRRSANLLVVAATLHVVAAIFSLLLIPVFIRNSPQNPELPGVLYLIATFGIIMQVGFAAVSGVGFVILRRAGPNVVSAGVALLVVGILAAIASILLFGGIVGFVAGILTAYAGNKVRKPAPQTWIPPSSWISPPQPPSPPSF